MEYDIIFWFVCFSAVSGLIPLLARLKSARSGWVWVYVAILGVCVTGRWSKRPELIYASAAMWVLLVLLPAMLGSLYLRRFLQQRYGAARRVAQLLRILHPGDGWRELPKIVGALELAQKGQLTEAVATLKNFQDVKSAFGLSAMAHLYRLTNQWDQLLELQRHHPELERHTEVLVIFLRALGETGDVDGLVALYERHKHQIGRLGATGRDLSRLVLFAFLGKRKLVERLLSGSLALLPAPTRDFWLATADLYGGERQAAKEQFERLLPVVDPSLRLSVERRLGQLNMELKPPSDAAGELIEFVAVEQAHDESFGARPSLFSKQAHATQLLIFLNALVFGLEIYLGGSENPDTIYRMGALHAPTVRSGEWWRLVASLFLHWGPLHLLLNMIALWLLAPFVEFALGSRKFLLVYFLAGIGSMSLVMSVGSGPHNDQLTVGASGCVMGLIGATGALMLRGWLRDKALAARRRLIAMFLIIGMQTLFDLLVPQVSMTAHLSGAVIGFVVTMMLRDRLKTSPMP